jgi:hypothetical protein
MSTAAQTLAPASSGTIRNLPELGIVDIAPVGADVQSTYFRTTNENREFRRGIAEFSIPPTTIASATLVLVETRGTSGTPVPPDVHNVTSYTPADLAVTKADYDRGGDAVGTFSTDSNLEPQTFRLDVTALAASGAGGTIGFRVQLAVDPVHSDLGSLGSQFAVTLETIAASFDALADAVRALEAAGELDHADASALLAKIKAAERSVAQGNTNAARRHLEAFVNDVEALVRKGELTPEQAQPLIDVANALLATL